MACAMRCLMCCFGFATCCGCRDRVTARLVFFPPTPFYTLEETQHGLQTLWLVEDGKRCEPYASAHMRMAWVETRLRSRICTLWLGHPEATTTILYAHGNAADLGCLRDHLLDLARRLRVNVFAYEYTGYGLSAGPMPTMAHTLADAEAAYDYLVATYPHQCERVVLYGQSIGSGPTSHLASKRRCNGVVLHAGIASALRVLQPDLKSSPFYDIYRNVDLLPRVPAPVFVVHGVADVEIPLAHGQALARAAQCQFPPWWVEGAGHNDIEVEHRAQWLAHMDEFVRYVEQTTPTREECDDPTLNHPGRGRTAKGKQEHHNKNGQQQNAAAAAAAGRMSIEMQPLNHDHRRNANDEGVASGAPAAAAAAVHAAASSVPPAAALSAAPSFSLSSASSASSMELLSPEQQQQQQLGAEEEHEHEEGLGSAEPLAADARRAGPVPSPSMEVQFADAHAAPSPSVERQAADGQVASALDAV